MNISILVKYIFFSSLLSTSNSLQAGIGLDATRLIISANETEGVIVKNSQADKSFRSYLIQSRVTEYGKNTKPVLANFFVSPPIFKLNPGENYRVRIHAVSIEKLPKDRESVFSFITKAIPNTPDSALNNHLTIIVSSSIKLFYRPAGLTENPEITHQKITASRQNNKLVIHNPTPYYVTFQTLNVGGKPLKHLEMVPPRGIQSYTIPAGVSGRASWQIINDYGGFSERVERSI